MIPAPSCLGKLPLHGDFLRIRVNQGQKAKLDHWFASMGKSNKAKASGSDEQSATTNMASELPQPWCFVIRGSLLGTSNQLVAAGVIFDSFDKIGRGYPFIMYQFVPRRWLINHLKEPDHWLNVLQRFAKSCYDKESSEIDAMLNQLWNIYKPQLIDYFKSPSLAERHAMTKQSDRLLLNWKTNQSKTQETGVMNPPWANWPHNLNLKKQASIWWKLDDSGRYIDCIEHDTLDRGLLEQLLGRA